MRRFLRLLFLAAVVGVAWRSGLPQRLSVHQVVQSSEDLASGKTKSDLRLRFRHDQLQRTLKTAVREYRTATGEAPTSFDDLIRQGLLENSDRNDEWNRQLRLEFDRHVVTIQSAGADGVPGTADDWTLTL